MSEYTMKHWEKAVAHIATDIPGFEVLYKEEDPIQRLISKISFWNDYGSYVTTLYPKVYFPNRSYVETYVPVSTLEHEWVHLKDQKSFFGMCPNFPAWLNMGLFSIVYLSPQMLALGSVFAVVNPWFLLCLLFLAPLPAPGRAWAEVRAYRRSLEKGSDIDQVSARFTGAGYYFMMPFKGLVLKWLDMKPSPYLVEMDTYMTK